MSRTPEQIEEIYNKIKSKKSAKGIRYTKANFCKELGIGTVYLSRLIGRDNQGNPKRTPGRQTEIILDFLELKYLRSPDQNPYSKPQETD